MTTPPRPCRRATLVIVALSSFPSSLFPQGPLIPPGAPAPAMKTLDQVEARIIVDATNTPGDAGNTFIISQPGSYYLTGNIIGEAAKHGISIQADDVTLDLNGFALNSAGGANVRGINAPLGQKNQCVRNGTIRGWSDGGVRVETVSATYAEKLRLSENAGSVGIYVGNGSFIKDCVANANGTGFKVPDRCQIISCISTVNSGSGFESADYGMIADCTASRNTGYGIKVGGSCSIVRCSATRNVETGIRTEAGCTISDCTAGQNVRGGVYTYQSSVTNCSANSNGASGLFTSGIVALDGSVANSTANYNTRDGISAFSSSVVNCGAIFNAENGIVGQSVAACRASNNGLDGISATGGGITNSTSSYNGRTGIYAPSVTNSVSGGNGSDGIYSTIGGVVAFSSSSGNNLSNNGSVDIRAPFATRTGNNPAP